MRCSQSIPGQQSQPQTPTGLSEISDPDGARPAVEQEARASEVHNLTRPEGPARLYLAPMVEGFEARGGATRLPEHSCVMVGSSKINELVNSS